MYTKYFAVAGITVRLQSELPIEDSTFAPKFRLFQVEGPGRDTVHLLHRFSLPPIDSNLPDPPFYNRSPWRIYRSAEEWIYVLEASPDVADTEIRQVAFASLDHSKVEIHNGPLARQAYLHGNAGSLTLSPTDQILLARLLADRNGCYFHSDGVNMDGKGYLFVGHSGAGKSTIATLLKDEAEILCDDRMIVRKWPDGFFIHGNWSHGTLPIVSANSAPLRGIFFLEQSTENTITPSHDRMINISNMLGCLIRPLVTKDWWEKMLDLVEDIVYAVPCYRLGFDTSGKICQMLRRLR